MPIDLNTVIERIRVQSGAHPDPRRRTEFAVLYALIRFLDIDEPEWREEAVKRMHELSATPYDDLRFDLRHMTLHIGPMALDLTNYLETLNNGPDDQ